MQVSTIAELDTHAVIGGGEAKAFGMDDSAELYALLSDKIYRDKKRAAMRETICNAWDAHIMVGKTDVPVEITVTETEIKIRDFGPGIPLELLHPIYCIYGKSTKVKDENQTGGFGLGSKAPFAVTDHFTIVNQHDGLKTVHAISRGGVATDGKPEMREMFRTASTETGLTVTIPIQQPKDRYEFENHIRAVVKQGGMLATLNGVPLERFDFTEARKHEFGVIPNIGLNEGRVYVLYGTVMYPLTNTDDAMTRLAVEAINLCGTNSILVLIPPPNSIGVTPSREALSFSPLTDETLNRLLNKAIKTITRALDPATRRLLTSIVESRSRLELDDYVSPRSDYPAGILSTPDMIADHAVSTHGHHHVWIGVDTRRKLYKIAQKMFRDDRRFYRRAPQNFGNAKELHFKRTSTPALRIASKMGLLKELMLFDIYRHRHDYPGPKTKRIGEYERSGHVYPVLCVARNMRDLRPMLALKGREFYGHDRNTYVPGMVMRQWTEKNLKRLQELCGHFKIALELFDYEEAKANRKPAVRKNSADKYFILEDVNPKGRDLDRAASCEDPSFYMMTWQRDEIARMPFNDAYRARIAELYPKTALITTKGQEEKLKKAGCRNLHEVLAARLVELTKKREVVYGETIRHDRFVKDGGSAYHYSAVEAALKLAKKEPRIAKLLFPDRATPGELHKEAKLIWDFLTSAESMSDETKTIVTQAKDGLKKACGKTFKPMSLSKAEEHFRYLNPICGAWFLNERVSEWGDQFTDDLIETIKFLQRRSKQKTAKKTAVNSNTTALKEAA